jgi:hypothetical protein
VSDEATEERRELEEAGWEMVERQGGMLWRNPQSGHLYPQSAAIDLLRRGRVPTRKRGRMGSEKTVQRQAHPLQPPGCRRLSRAGRCVGCAARTAREKNGGGLRC